MSTPVHAREATKGRRNDSNRTSGNPLVHAHDRTDKGIDDVQFYAAMTRRFGYRGTPWVLSTVFRGIDADGDGEVCFDELWEWVRGRRRLSVVLAFGAPS